MSQIAHYKCNDNAAKTTVLDSLGTHNATAGANTSVFDAVGLINGCFNFAGSYYFYLASHADFNFGTSPASISLWVKRSASISAEQCVFAKRASGGTTEDGYSAYFTSNTNLRIHYNTDVNYTVPNVSDGNWHHIIVVFDYTNHSSTVYFDNSLIGTQSHTQDSQSNIYSFYVGTRRSAPAGSVWNGYVDDVRVYNHILSEDERNFLYNSGSGTEEEEITDATLSLTENIDISDSIDTLTNPQQVSVTENINVSDSETLQTNPEVITIIENVNVSDSELFEQNVVEVSITENVAISDTVAATQPWIPTHYPKKILSYNPLIYVTDTIPATLVVVDITVPESPANVVYELTGVSNANSVSYNSTNGYVYAVTDDGKVVKIDTTNFSSQTIIDTLDTDNLNLSAVVSPELKLFAGTDDASGEVILIDEAEFKNVNLDIRFLQEWKRNINFKINTILAKFANMDIRYIAEQTAKIGLDIRFLKYDYSVASQYPLSYLDWKVYINDVQMDTINDIDMKSITINHNIENKSTATFKLHRQHDKLDFTNTGVASQITNQNEVKIYINNILEFDGKISNYDCSLEGEQVNITALMDTPVDDRSTVNIPLPSVNEDLHLYHCLNDSISIENPYQDERAVIVGDDGKYWAAGIWVYGIKNALVFGSDSAAQAYITATKTSVFTSKNPSVASRESTVQYYKGVKVNLGTSIKENVKRYTAFTDVADSILDGTFNQQQNWDYFWKVSLRDFTQGIVEKPGFGESSFTNPRYIGTSVSPITSDTYILDSAYYSYQRIYDDTETELGYYYIGSGPFLEVSCPNGKKTVADRWEDRADGLYTVRNAAYDYREYCQIYAQNEYNKLTNINGDVLPITQANLTITLNGYYYYGIKLLKRLNIVNTTTANIYKNLNGFPVAVKSISISSNDMKVMLNCDNQKVQDELDEIDSSLPDITNYKKEAVVKLQYDKYDPIARQWVV